MFAFNLDQEIALKFRWNLVIVLFQQLLVQSGPEITIIAAAIVVGLIAIWIIVTIPVWIAAKVLTLGKAKFTRAMLVTAAGPLVYAIVFFFSAAVLSAALGNQAVPAIVAFILAFVAWIGVFKKGFDTGWIRALAIAILATVVFAVIGVVITLIVGALVPGAPPITPIPLQQV
jgi:hypothetical protein